MKLRKPTTVEIAVQVLLAVFVAAFILDYIGARSESACSAPEAERTHDCYPWGMAEGPMEGGIWNYASKEIYLKSALVGIGFLSVAMITPVFASGMWTGLAAVLIVLTFDRLLSEWITRLF